MKPPATHHLKDYTAPPFAIDRVDLIFDIQKNHTTVTSTLSVRKCVTPPDKPYPLTLDLKDLAVTKVIAGTMVLLPGEYQVTEESLIIPNTPETFDLEIECRIKPDQNTSLEGLYRSGKFLCTQCEAQGFRKITPFLDRPDVMAVYSCTIIADKTEYPILLSNGNPVKTGGLDGNRHYARWEDPHKKPSYLFALVAGDLACLEDRFTTRSGRKVDLKIYSEHENINRCGHAMRSLKQSMKWDEERFNLEYDLDLYQIVAINDFNAGAMENKGLNIFNAKYVLADPASATDEDFMNIQGVIGHEYFHNWTGNRVTLKNWFQLSLKEGLTVFRDQEFSSDLNSRGVKRISCVRNLRAFQFPEDSGPMTHPVRPDSYIKIDNFYTMTVYEKGSEVVRMLHQLIGEIAFQKGIQLYFERFDGQAVTVEDFLDVMQEASGKDLDHFSSWYFQSGTPEVRLTRAYNTDTRELTLTFTQATKPDRNQKEKKPLHIPVNFGILDSEGRDITPKGSRLLELTRNEQSFTFKNMPGNCRPSVFRQFSAPVRLVTDFSSQDLAFLMARDTDGFSQWDAAQTLFIQEIKTLVQAVQTKKPLALSSTLETAFLTALTNPEQDKAFLAKMLTLPLETELKDHFKSIDVEAIHQARRFLEKALAVALEGPLTERFDQCKDIDPADISHDAMAGRALKNLCLGYLGRIQDPEAEQRVSGCFESARTMTEELAALKLLADMGPDLRDRAVDQFYSKWKNDTLVLDKWFSVQAGSMLPDTLEKIKALCGHPDFSMTNPNKVRSLIFIFALYNPVHFHDLSGTGYAFTADRILELDKINQMVAARLAGCFNLWKRYDEKRQELMRSQLERIAAAENLSKNVYEIVSRALE